MLVLDLEVFFFFPGDNQGYQGGSSCFGNGNKPQRRNGSNFSNYYPSNRNDFDSFNNSRLYYEAKKGK